MLRFTTAERAEREQKFASAADPALARELRSFDDLASRVTFDAIFGPCFARLQDEEAG